VSGKGEKAMAKVFNKKLLDKADAAAAKKHRVIKAKKYSKA